MLTPRAWWFLSLSLLVLLLGLAITSPGLMLAGLALLLWFGGEWLLFAVRVPLAARRLRVVREVRDGRGPVVTLCGTGWNFFDLACSFIAILR